MGATNDVETAAAVILRDLRAIRARHPVALPATPAMLWERRVPRRLRGPAFRLLNRRGLIAEAYPGTPGARLWRASDAAMALSNGGAP